VEPLIADLLEWIGSGLAAALLLLAVVRRQQAARERNRRFNAGLATVLAFHAGNAAL
jgi:hypothetical protein